MLKRMKKTLGSLIGFFVAISLIQTDPSTFFFSSLTMGDGHRQLSEALENGGCFVTPAVEVGPEVIPIYSASYPGSGARMTWNLIEAMTGLVTGDDWESNGRKWDVVSVKTHYPHNKGRKLPWDEKITRALVVVRNPMHAIPSYHNFLYEFQNNLENHSTRAPTEDWIKWRDDNFKKEIMLWKEHLEYYMEKYPAENRLIIPYEHLIDDTLGPNAAVEMSHFLAEGPGVEPIADASIPCVWGTVVNYKQKGGVPNTRKPLDKSIKYVGNYPIFPGSSRVGSKNKPYSATQLMIMIDVLNFLKQKYLHEDERLAACLGSYIDVIKAKEIPIIEAIRATQELSVEWSDSQVSVGNASTSAS